jgi:3-hydroxyisobutyrate dehydrogenase-like beta-hydroxyacid dehydrogenase
MPAESGKTPTVGILYPGEMGAALGRVLRREGLRVITTLEGRGPRTIACCREAGLEVVPTLGEVAEAAEVILSLVPPVAAGQVAEQYASCRFPAGVARRYVDLNSVAPATAHQIGQTVARRGVDFVDGAVHGLAAGLPERGTVYLSGPAAEGVAALLGRSLRVKVLGNEPGAASAFKMLVAGVNKGVVALLLEMCLAARQAGLLDELLACCKASYPGVLEVVERTLPTYPRHAGRRAEEMGELERTLGDLGLRPCLTRGARDLIAELSRLGLEERPGGWSLREVIEEAHSRGLLRLVRAGSVSDGLHLSVADASGSDKSAQNGRKSVSGHHVP